MTCGEVSVTLYDLYQTRQVLTMVVSLRMVGEKRAIVAGDRVAISPAMFSLFADRNTSMEERTHILKNIPCHIVGSSQKVPVDNITKIQSEVL
jgi:hypothetical protein